MKRTTLIRVTPSSPETESSRIVLCCLHAYSIQSNHKRPYAKGGGNLKIFNQKFGIHIATFWINFKGFACEGQRSCSISNASFVQSPFRAIRIHAIPIPEEAAGIYCCWLFRGKLLRKSDQQSSGKLVTHTSGKNLASQSFVWSWMGPEIRLSG